MGLSEDFYDMLRRADEHPEVMREAAEMVFSAPADAESDGLLALMYHEGFGVERDLDKAFVHASRAAQADEGVALYLLGYMCENAETPDQAEGGPRHCRYIGCDGAPRRLLRGQRLQGDVDPGPSLLSLRARRLFAKVETLVSLRASDDTG